jgi:hypothetical protein
MFIYLLGFCQDTTVDRVEFKFKQTFVFKKTFKTQKTIKVKLKNNLKENIICDSNFIINILDNNLNKLMFKNIMLGQRCLDCDVSKLKIIRPDKFSIYVSKKYITLKIPIMTTDANMNSTAIQGYHFYNKKNYLSVIYIGKNHIYYSDTIPLYVW